MCRVPWQGRDAPADGFDAVTAPLVRLIMQSRMSSTRLPGKALLPVGGLPAVVLAARRAANAGRQVVVATSDQAADDLLAHVVVAAGIACVRGSLDDVLDRFVRACDDLPETGLIVRLTADNVLPDGEFIERALASFMRAGSVYWSVRHPEDGLPYGMSAEVTTVAMLRGAHRSARDAQDREHVTPWIRRAAENTGAAGWLQDAAHLRCTLDDARDYARLARVFAGVSTPERAGWRELCNRLTSLDEADAPPSTGPRPAALLRYCLGTVQLGSEYGVANRTGKPAEAQAVELVRTALRAGVLSVDTARAYGSAEGVVGKALGDASLPAPSVVTKLDPLSHLADDASDAELQGAVNASIEASCRALGAEVLDTLLLHRWGHFRAFGGRVWRHLETIQARGVVRHLGASVYDADEALQALRVPAIEHLQVPFNLVDARLTVAGIESALAGRPDVTVHVRSVLLQGLLVSPAERWPAIPGIDVGGLVALLDSLAADAGFRSRAQLCIAYVLSHPWAHRLVIGCETGAQLRENLDLFGTRLLGEGECEAMRARLPALPGQLLDPSRWPRERKP